LNQTIPVQVSPPPPIQFSKTKVSAAYMRSLRGTKSASIMLNSPLSHLSKGSAAWERAVKAQTDVNSYMMGWTPRVIEEEPTPTSTEKNGIFSFFSRRSTTGPEIGSPAPHTTSNSAPLGVAGLVTVMKARGSSESPHSSDPSSAVPPPGFEPTPSLVSITASAVNTSSVVSSPTPESAPATSAVSRFLGRWSRTRAHSPHSSVSLDSNDLTFLENVPSYQDDDDENLEGLQAALKKISTNVLLPTQSVGRMSKNEFDRTLEAQAALAYDEELIEHFFTGEIGSDNPGSRYSRLDAKKNATPAPNKQATMSAVMMMPSKSGDPFSSLAASSSKNSKLVNDDFSSFMFTSSSTKIGPAARAQPPSITPSTPLAPHSTHSSQSISISDLRPTGLVELNDFGSFTAAPALPPKPATPPVLSPRLPTSPTPTASPLSRGAMPPAHKAVSLTPQSTGGASRPSAIPMSIAPLLPPPPGMRPISRGPAVDLLGGGAPPQKPQNPTSASDLAVLMGFETPSNGLTEPSRAISPPLVPFSPLPTAVRPSSAAAPKSNSSTQTGGLSAQDLSFFEGL
jgi:hypothetical protein